MSNIKKFRILKFKSKPILTVKDISKTIIDKTNFSWPSIDAGSGCTSHDTFVTGLYIESIGIVLIESSALLLFSAEE